MNQARVVDRRFAILATAICVATYAAAFFIKAYSSFGVHSGYHSYWCAWLYMHASWFANPLAWLCLLLIVFRRYGWATALGLLASITASSVFWFPWLGRPRGFTKVSFRLDQMLAGYWIWFGSMVGLTLVALLLKLRSPKLKDAGPLPTPDSDEPNPYRSPVSIE